MDHVTRTHTRTQAPRCQGLPDDRPQVESGVKLVRDTGDALKTIEGLVATINHHVDAIATSSREQSVGLSEVNSAVNQVD